MPLSRKKACDHCRRAKIRCNLDTPTCSRCLERGLQCNYEAARSHHTAVSHHPSATARSRQRKAPPSETTTVLPPDEASAVSSDLTASQFAESLQDLSSSTTIDDTILGWPTMDPIDESFFDAGKISPFNFATPPTMALLAQAQIPDQLDATNSTLGSSSGPSVLDLSDSSSSSTSPIPWLIESPPANDPIHNSALYTHSNSCIVVQVRSFNDKSDNALQKRHILRHCALSSVVVGQLTSYPRMMTEADRTPPFITAPCHLREELAHECFKGRRHTCFPKELAVCAGLVDMFYARTRENAEFVWKTIYAERERVDKQRHTFEGDQYLAALQAMTVYLLMQASDLETVETNGAHKLLRTVKEMAMDMALKYDWQSDLTSQLPSRQEWVFRESIRRTLTVLMIVDLILDGMSSGSTTQDPNLNTITSTNTNANHSSPSPSWSDLFHRMPLPSTRDLWDAPTNFSWQTSYERHAQRRNAVTNTLKNRGWGTTKPVTVKDVLDADLAGGLRDLQKKDSRFEFLPDVYLWCEGMDALGSLLWMIFPFEQWRRRTEMKEKW